MLDGHSGYATSRPAACATCPSSRSATSFYVEDARGKRIVFIVRKKKLYGRNAGASDARQDSAGAST